MTNDSVWLRIGDRTRELKGEDIKRLEYEKGSRHYEDEINEDAEIADLDVELIEEYKMLQELIQRRFFVVGG